LKKKLEGGSINFQNLREDFDNLIKKFDSMKIEYERTQNLLSEYKSENYYFKKEMEKLNYSSKISSSNKLNKSVVIESRKNSVNYFLMT